MKFNKIIFLNLVYFLIFPAMSLQANNITYYDSWDIPQYVKPNPNLATLKHYFFKNYNLLNENGIGKYTIKPLNNSEEFSTQLEKNDLITKEMNNSGLLSYLFYENGNIKYDYISPKNRFGFIYNNSTPYLSNSIGKSFVSYILGHAICEGKIAGINTKVNDWPLIKDTLYHNQSLLNLINMAANDNNYVDDTKGMKSSGRWYNIHSIKSFAERELKGSKQSSNFNRKYNYNGLLTNIIMNYIVHKTDYEFEALLNRVFQEKVKIKHSIKVFYQKYPREDDGKIIRNSSLELTPEMGTAYYMFYATRYDFLRVAKSMLDDWNEDNCVGKYLKTVYKNRISKQLPSFLTSNPKKTEFYPSSYGGQFHFDYFKMKNRKILGMDGYGGQSILIDFDNSRIVVVNTVHNDYDWKALVYDVIKNGDIIR